MAPQCYSSPDSPVLYSRLELFNDSCFGAAAVNQLTPLPQTRSFFQLSTEPYLQPLLLPTCGNSEIVYGNSPTLGGKQILLEARREKNLCEKKNVCFGRMLKTSVRPRSPSFLKKKKKIVWPFGYILGSGAVGELFCTLCLSM